MATLVQTHLGLIDHYKSQDKYGRNLPLIEILNQQNPVLQDAVMMECNSGTQHVHSIRSGLPEVTWGRLYQGIPNSKSKRAQVTDTTGFVRGISTVDMELLRLAGDNANNLRMQEAMGYMEAMSQEVSSTVFYGNTATAPDEFMGLAPRFNSKTASNGGQIIDAGGTGSDNTSMWIVTWGANTCQMLYPKGTMAGMERQDMGEQRVLDSSNNPYYAMEEVFKQHAGLAVKDWRFITRIANIDVSEMKAGNVKLFDFLRQAWYRNEGSKVNMRSPESGQMAIYCNRDVAEALDRLQTNAGASDSFIRLKPMEIQGKQVETYRGIPIRIEDALLNTESRVV